MIYEYEYNGTNERNQKFQIEVFMGRKAHAHILQSSLHPWTSNLVILSLSSRSFA